MPIQVTCPKCFKRFQVSDKFAGKTGPCPNCKEQLKVPEKNEEVVIHAPDDGAPKDRSGQSVLKPLKRTETDVTRKGLLLTFGAIFAAVGLAIGVRLVGFFAVPTDGGFSVGQIITIAIGAIALAPPLVWAGYTFVRDSELEPFRGTELRNRVAVSSAILAALWLLYAFIPSYVLELDYAREMSFMVFGIIFCIMLVIGAFASAEIFELEFANGLYLLTALIMALISGISLLSFT
jgi:cation transport ATPase